MFGINKTQIDTDPEKIRRLLNRGVEDIFIKEDLEKKLKSGKQLRVKLGIDPTSTNIHIGNAVPLHKLRGFQNLGHKVVLIIGDFTALIGDPTDKLEKRPMLTKEQIEINLETYKEQAGKILDLSKVEIRRNSEWLEKLNFREIANLAEAFSVSQMSNRRNFKDRLDRGDEVSLREFLYPLMQGYDSVAIDADVELGGFDQLFNLKAGRTVQKHYNKPQQDVLTVVMLEGTDGEKMSKSVGNVINVTDEPNDMYGKVMSVRDDLVEKYFLLTTEMSLEEIEKVREEFSNDPKTLKMRLAKELVVFYHGENAAKKAENNFENTFSKGGIPDDIEEVEVIKHTALVDVLLENKLVESKGEFKRLIKEGAIRFNDDVISEVNVDIDISGIIKVGKRRFLKVIALLDKD